MDLQWRNLSRGPNFWLRNECQYGQWQKRSRTRLRIFQDSLLSFENWTFRGPIRPRRYLLGQAIHSPQLCSPKNYRRERPWPQTLTSCSGTLSELGERLS